MVFVRYNKMNSAVTEVCMRRFYALKENITGNTVLFDRAESAHICRVLRLEPGEQILVCDGSGMDYECTLTACGEKCAARIERCFQNKNEPQTELVLFQSVIKNEKMDFVIQKAAELGISRIVPVLTERTVVKITPEEAHKQARWQKIALEACKQCGRSKVPAIEPVCTFQSAVEKLSQYPLKLTAYEEEKSVSIAKAVRKSQSAAYFIGPEGGITEAEHKSLENAGAVSVSLGRRILRAETAAIVAGAVILCLMGEMDV